MLGYTLCCTRNGYPTLWHMTVYMIVTGSDLWLDLDTSLVICDRLPIVTVIAYLQLCQFLLSLFVLLSCILLFSYLSCYLVFLSAVVLTIIYAHVFFCTSCFPFTHTLIMVAFWRPWVCTSSYWTIVLLCRCSMSWYTLRGVGHCLPLFILVPSFLLYSCYFMTLSVLLSAAIFFLSFILLSCVAFICHIAVIFMV